MKAAFSIRIDGDKVRAESIIGEGAYGFDVMTGLRLIGPRVYNGHLHGSSHVGGNEQGWCFPMVVDSIAHPADVPCSTRPSDAEGEHFMVMWFIGTATYPVDA